MKKAILLAAACALAAAADLRAAGAVVGQPAPAFTAHDSKGQAESLADFKGHWLVLEWTNSQCPFVGKHYGSGNMQRLQKKYTGEGVSWLSVISSAPGQQGYVDAAEANALTDKRGASPTAVLLDPQGELGRLYGAKTTPHMFVIDPKGTLVYQGAIDDKPSTDKADIATATNYVAEALDAGMAGQPIEVSSSQPYGCGVKYSR